jgi:hypothetical protein
LSAFARRARRTAATREEQLVGAKQRRVVAHRFNDAHPSSR